MAGHQLRQLTGTTWVIAGPTNIGLLEGDEGVYLIDSGNDKDTGRRIRKLLDQQGWSLKGIINTHSNADHIGGNDYLQRQTECGIWAPRAERAFIEYPKLEAAFLWGGLPVKELNSKFFEAKPSRVTHLIEPDAEETAGGMKVVPLPGHFFGMIGLLTGDRVLFLGDAMFGGAVLEKYKLPFIYDVKAYRESIERARGIDADYYIVSHGEPLTEIDELADLNLALVDDVEAQLLHILEQELSFDDILKAVCDHYGIVLDAGQYALVGSTLRSFLSHLYNESRLRYEFRDNRLCWQRV
jgi:glyoxylase-like metal-dependent hydrolase (beta-lactamase superfamily II)